MRYHQLRKMDISNGPGIRVSIFVQGCTFHCKGCFNPETWDFKGGMELTDDVIDKLLIDADKNYIRGLSILGGEPLHPSNIEGVTNIAKKFKEKFKDKDIWLWSGFLFDDKKDEEIFKYLDVVVDGQFKIEEKDPRLSWKGSKNQRVIDVKKSLKSKKIVLYED